MDDIMRILETPLARALMWLVAALVVASIARALAKGAVGRSSLRSRLTRGAPTPEEGGERYERTQDYVGRLAFLLVFLLFVPVIFITLGVQGAGEPVFEFLDRVWGFLPNVLAASVVLTVGLMAAQLVRQLIVPLFGRLRLERLERRAGLGDGAMRRIPEALASVVYALIVVPVIIVALQVLNISAISDPATNMLNTIVGFVPNALAAAIVVGLGVFVGRLAGTVVRQLVGATGVDGKAQGMLDAHAAGASDLPQVPGISVSGVLGTVVQALIVVLFAVEGLDILGLAVLRNMAGAVVAYLPNVLAAAAVFAVAAYASQLARKALDGSASARYAPMAQACLWVVAAFMVLSQLNIAQAIVQGGFLMAAGALAVAFALAFGLGGRDHARQVLERIDQDAPDRQAGPSR